MELKNKTILITGGASGIGLEASRQFLELGCKVIITGRNQEKLDKAKQLYPALITIKSDASSQEDALELFQKIKELGGIDILYNNAGVMDSSTNLGIENSKHYESAKYEIDVNYLGVIFLNNLFLNMLKERKESAIINTTSILSYVPSLVETTYSASKVALRFYTETLRKHLQIIKSSVKIFELIPPVVETEMTAERKGKKLSTEQLVNALIDGLKRDNFTIRIGDSKTLYFISRLFPKLAFKLVNPKNSYHQIK
ncbi:SDR family oxidoreductase [Chryseobacterium sp. M5A1_1a]